MYINERIPKYEVAILLFFLAFELIYNYTTQLSLYGLNVFFSRYAFVYIAAFVYNIYLFVGHGWKVLFQKGIFKTIFPTVVFFAYMACYSKEAIDLIWHYISYILFFFNLYVVYLDYRHRKTINRVVDVLWYLGILGFMIIKNRNVGMTITGPTYLLLLLFPLFYQEKKSAFVFRFLILTVVVIISGKRGAFLAFTIAALLSYLTNALFNNKNRSNIFKIAFSMGAMTIIVLGLLSINGSIMISRLGEMQDDGGSGRDVISEVVWESFLFSNSSEKIWGHGSNSVIGDDLSNGLSAHDDFLEILYDYGIVGLVLLIIMVILVLLQALTSIKKSSPNVQSFLFLFFCVLIICFVSHIFIYPHNYFEFLIVYSLLLSREYVWRNSNPIN